LLEVFLVEPLVTHHLRKFGTKHATATATGMSTAL
jgi:hypothetical protein